MTLSNDSDKLRVFHGGKFVKEGDSVSYVNGSVHTRIVAPIVHYCFTYVYRIVRRTLGLKIPFKLNFKEEGKSLKEGKRLIKDETKSLCALGTLDVDTDFITLNMVMEEGSPQKGTTKDMHLPRRSPRT